MAKHPIETDKVKQIKAPSEHGRRDAVTSEATPEETVERMRALPKRAARLRELIDASREAYSR